jgi:CBS domain-containing protein
MRTASDIPVADLMTAEPICVQESDTVAEGERLLRDHRVTGLPVIDAEGRLVGVFSQTDVLFLKDESVLEHIPGQVAQVTVGDVMSHPPVTVDAFATVEEAGRVMLDQDVHRVVATDADGKPIGVLSAMDFVRLAVD